MMSKASRAGYVFETEVERGFDLIKNLQVYKVPDGKSLGRIIPMKVPCDFIVSKDGEIATFEAKQTKLPRIPWRNFKDHQLQWVIQNPDVAFFIVNFNNRKDVNRTFVIDGHAIRKAIAEFPNSVPMQYFADNGLEVERKTAKHHPEKKGAFIDLSYLE